MIHPVGRAGYEAAADRFDRLSPQLYLQVTCQFQLVLATLRQALLYYPQRQPAALGRFRWRVDQKDERQSVFERSFHDLAGPMLQSMTITEPTPLLKGADYRHLARFFPEEGPPSYLKEVYGIEVDMGFSGSQMMREDFEFVDSRTSDGVQVVDLLASGLRRCLRGGFSDQPAAAAFLGALMVQAPHGQPPIELLSLTPVGEVDRASPAFASIHRMRMAAQPMPKRRE